MGTGALITMLPKISMKVLNLSTLPKFSTKYFEVKKNEVNFEGKILLTGKNDKDREQLPVMIQVVKIPHRCSDQIGLTL